MISYSDFKNDDGKTDWRAYREARIASGEICSRCDTFIVPSIFGDARTGPILCGSCKSIDVDTDRVHHDKYIRCPQCRHSHEIEGVDWNDLYQEGWHECIYRDELYQY